MKADKWVIYSSYDVEGAVDETSGEQLAAYREAGFKTLVIDTSPIVTEARRAQWDRLATRWLQRENVGYDFGSYRCGLALLLGEENVQVGRLDLVITNDSCFGPFTSIPHLMRDFDSRPEDPNVVYGITDSLQYGHHIQSYWLYFRAAACQHAARFFDAMVQADGREQAIEHGELALSAHLRAAGCRLVVCCPLDQTLAYFACFRGRPLSTLEFLGRRALKRWKYSQDADTQCLRFLLGYPSKMEHFNPAVLFGVQLYQTRRCPFVKKSMFRENVYRSPEIPPGLSTRGMTNTDVARLLDKR